MRILGLHYFAPPLAVVSSRRLVGIYRELAKRADSIEIITSVNHKRRDPEEAYAHDFPLHFVNGQGLREKLFGRQKSSVINRQKTTASFRFFNRWRQSFPFLLLADEGGPAYYRNAIRQASQIIESKSITHLFSSYRPWVDHRIAAALKKRYPHLIWIADFRDLPIDRVRQDIALPALQKWWARRVIRRADEVWLVSEGQRAQFGKLHPNTRVIYNGLSSFPKPSEPKRGETFMIGYTGSLYPGLQSVEMLWEALSKVAETDRGQEFLSAISFSYHGKDDEVWKNWMEENPTFLQICKFANIQICKKKPQSQALKSQSTNTLNLLLSWSAPGYHGVLTAKLFDYLAAGRPILALVNGPDDPELRRIIEGSGAGRVFCQGQETELKDWLHELYGNWRNNDNRLPWSTDAEQLTYLTMENQIGSAFLLNQPRRSER